MVAYKPIDWIEWLPKDLYHVGDDGSLRKRYGGRWRQIRPALNSCGLLCVSLRYEGRGKEVGVATLVLRAFVGPRPIGCIAYRYPDRDPRNCRLSNLRWAVRGAGQVGMPVRGVAGRKGEDSPSSVLSREDVIRIRGMAACGFNFSEIAEYFGLNKSHVARIVRGEVWSCVPEGIIEETPGRAGLNGERNPNARLTVPRVKAIRKMARLGLTLREIAERFGIDRSTVGDITTGRTWKGVASPG